MYEQKIVVVDDNKQTLLLLQGMLEKSFTNCKFYTFSKIDRTFFDFIANNKISLYIIDIVLKGEEFDGKELATQILQIQKDAIFLFMSGYNYKLSSFCSLKGKTIYDFIQKPVSSEEIENRVSVLLNVSKSYSDLQENIKTVKHAVWDIINYSKLFVVITDKDLNVTLANWFLSTSLGFDNEEDIIGKSWVDFIPNEDRDLITELLKIITVKEDYYYKPGELVTKLLLKDSVISVKWFITYINDQNNLIFNIGIPLEDTTYTSTEESIRSYYKDILEQDKTMIESLRDTMMNMTK